MNPRNPIPVIASFLIVTGVGLGVIGLVYAGLCWITRIMEAAR